MWLPDPLYISFGEDNVVIPDTMMFCYWVFNMYVRKFRPQLIELTSFKPNLLIRFIMNKTC